MSESNRVVDVVRASIDAKFHRDIDVLLKSLQVAARRSKALFQIVDEEHALLSRLTYKGRNQHRAALFWRCVLELKRILSRVHSSKARTVFSNTPLQFHSNPNNLTPSELLRTAWTQVPTPESLSYLSRLSESFLPLFNKAKEVAERVYLKFVAQLETAAFLPLILTLIGIVSRTRALALELADISATFTRASARMSQIMQDAISFQLARHSPTVDVFMMEQTDSCVLKHTESSAVLQRKSASKLSKRKPHRVKDEIDEIFGF